VLLNRAFVCTHELPQVLPLAGVSFQLRKLNTVVKLVHLVALDCASELRLVEDSVWHGWGRLRRG
jgi:hypothetical protein